MQVLTRLLQLDPQTSYPVSSALQGAQSEHRMISPKYVLSESFISRNVSSSTHSLKSGILEISRLDDSHIHLHVLSGTSGSGDSLLCAALTSGRIRRASDGLAICSAPSSVLADKIPSLNNALYHGTRLSSCSYSWMTGFISLPAHGIIQTSPLHPPMGTQGTQYLLILEHLPPTPSAGAICSQGWPPCALYGIWWPCKHLWLIKCCLSLLWSGVSCCIWLFLQLGQKFSHHDGVNGRQ